MESWKLSFRFTFKIQAFCSKSLSIFRYFLPRYFQDQAFSSKLLPRSGIFLQVASKNRHFLPNYFQGQAFSSKLLSSFTHFLQDLARPDIFSKIFQDTCKDNTLSSKILEVKSERLLQKLYGNSTSEYSEP